MKRIAILIAVLITLCLQDSLWSQDFTVWNNIRNSSYTQNDSMYIRCELTPLIDAQTFLYHFWGNRWRKTDLIHINGQTYQSVIPVTRDNNIYCRYRTSMPNFFDFPDIQPAARDSIVVMMAGYLSSYPIPPDINLLARVADDAVGDIEEETPDYLDITGSYFSFSDTHLHTAIANNYNGFPTGPIIGPYNLYTNLIINPETVTEDSVFYGIVYANIIGIVTPGLYRFTGLSFDGIRRIGNVSHHISDNKLFLSCLMEDLTSDPFFGDWPNISNSLVVLPMTMQVNTSLDITIGDTGTLSLQNFNKHVIEPFENRVPGLSNFTYLQRDGYVHINIDYYDPDSHFPIISRMVFTDLTEVELNHISFDFSDRVRFTALFSERELQGVIEFSDNGHDIVRYPVSVSVENDYREYSVPLISVYPNPYILSGNSQVMRITSEDVKLNDVRIFDVKGRLIKTLTDDSDKLSPVWRGFNDNGEKVSSGVYFIRVENNGRIYNRKIMLVR